ncbi:ABC transporter ATP-binding protein [Clostridium sp. NSJ-6]|uniref:ABC transporter ATP-binding protein n=1 Tax=Clostridium hominis TaxID=2763036 RepID=A0ABR7DED4_9CLOT|nr:ABC transporter ATP-binding protein [Clostridium hominis]MBC5629728.1 ABC transporter ATP-binding protein [Clostridium hominis]
MCAKSKNYLSFHKDGLEGLKMIHKVDSSAIPITLLHALVKALYPYITLFLGAFIIDSLIERNFKYSIIFALALIGGNFVFGIIQDILERVDDYKGCKIGHLTTLEIRKKALEIDYETLEDAKTLEKLNSAVYSMQFQGGFAVLLKNYCSIFQGIFSIIASVSLVVYLCFQIGVQDEGVLSILTSITASIIFIVILFGVTIISNFIVTKYNNNKSLELFNKHIKAERTLNYYIEQVYNDYEKGKVIRLYDMKEIIGKRFRESNDFVAGVFEEFFPVKYFVEGAGTLISGVSLMFSYMFVMLKVLSGAITIGGLTKYVGAITQLNNGMIQIVKVNDEIRLQCEYLKTFSDFIKLKNKRETGTIPVEKRLDNEYEIEFHNVSFAYPGSSEMILKKLSCKINMKDKLAVVGRNGAGKTTFIKLIARLYDPTEGYITLNGVDIKKYDYKEYLKLFSVVFQDFSLFAFPVEENVVTDVEVDEERVWKTLELAGVKDVVDEMPLNIKTPLFKYDEGGVECSGGEQQKIAIARALYKDAPFVILDEPTAALDPISEYEIYSKFNELVKDKTSIYISHRMSSCRFCDDIMVFDNGKIVQRGSHDKLMEDKDNIYSKLWNAQASYYTK